jgi:hypothetical protein
MNYRFLSSFALVGLVACGGSPSTQQDEGLKTGPTLQTSGKRPADTGQVATADLYPSMSASADEAGVHVWAAFLYDVGDFLALGAGDTLTATVGGTSKVLTRDPTDTNAHYTATFPPSADASQVVVSLTRTNGQPSAPASVVPIAPAFTLAPSSFPIQPATDPSGFMVGLVLLDITPGFDPKTKATYTATGPCVPALLEDEHDAVLDNSGAFTPGQAVVGFDLGRYLPPDTRNCPVHVTIRVKSEGTWDPALSTDAKADGFDGSRAASLDVVAASRGPGAGESGAAAVALR